MIHVNVVPGSGLGAFPTASNGPKLTRSQRPAGSEPRALSVPLQLDPAERTEGSGGVTVVAVRTVGSVPARARWSRSR